MSFDLCTGKSAEHPWFVESIGIRIYTIEELCWFLHNNLYLIDSSVTSPSLVTWIRDELGLKTLARKLSDALERPDRDVSYFIIPSFQEIGWLSPEELRRVRDELTRVQVQPEEQRAKTRADYLVAGGRCSAAITAYRKILDNRTQGNLGTPFYASVWNNLGCAYTKQFRFREAADAFSDAEHYGVTIGPTMTAINNLTLSLIGLLGGVLYLRGIIDLGRISSFVLYSRKFAGPINAIAEVFNELFSALAASERVFTLLDEEEETADAPEARLLDNVRGNVSAEHVAFGYEPGQPILKDLNLTAPAGKLIAIVGPTGAGKTTIINLLMRFYDPDSGVLRIDGQEIRTSVRRSVRGAWAMVLQDTWVFQGTIFENIAYGKEDATMEEVVAAAKAARIHPFIMRLPQGYDTVISEDGGNISKGQKQLLTIARAMLYDAPMLILDEATSNVDTATEREIQRAMRELMRDRTCCVIAHRLSTIEHADQILVLRDGDVVEQGTHRQLMARNGFYRRLYAAQFD